jgi:DNA invertase Pin-like site-specific DNA recombinase
MGWSSGPDSLAGPTSASLMTISDARDRASGARVSRSFWRRSVTAGRAVVSIEASRLARNGRDWQTLLEFCDLVGTLIADEDGVYDPSLPNDRLLLGMKGTMSEMELTIRRGELFTSVAIGYLRNKPDRIEKDPPAARRR